MDHKDIVSFQSKRAFNILAKRILMLLEDLQSDHDIHFDKLRNHLPEEFAALVEQADYFDVSKFAHYRKRILDSVGDSYREVAEELDKYTLTIKDK